MSITGSDTIKLELELELQKLITTEEIINNELNSYYLTLSQGKSLLKGILTYETTDINYNINKIELFESYYEIILKDSKKLTNQIEECRTLSDRLSIMVRRLDMIQLRAQEALACTEDVINIKECHNSISLALENQNLPLAVSYLKQVHDIDEQAARASDDYGAIQQIEREVKDLVRTQFEQAIRGSNLEEVLKLCPLLHVVGLESDATDMFLEFIETTVFIGISANAANITDNQITIYAEILSNIFNTAFTICQTYLPFVIQGLERTQGDILFIRRLHAKCEKEVNIVIQKYLSLRNVKYTINLLKPNTSSTSTSSLLKSNLQSSSTSSSYIPTPAEIHSLLDELALLLQYFGSYSRYLKILCDGAEHRIREHSNLNHDKNSTNNHNTTNQIIVFKSPTDFERLQQDLINKYYIEGETWLVKSAVQLLKNGISQYTSTTINSKDNSLIDIDGCFFIFQRCCNRALATSNIHAVCAILHVLSDYLSTDVLQQFSDSLNTIVVYIGNKMRDIMSRFLKSSAWYSGSEEVIDSTNKDRSAAYISQGLQNALLFASSLSHDLPTSNTNISTNNSSNLSSSNSSSLSSSSSSSTTTTLNTNSNGLVVNRNKNEGMWGVESQMEILNCLETCIRYTDRLRREITVSGKTIFDDSQQQQQQQQQQNNQHLGNNKISSKLQNHSDEMNKLQLCLEDFDSCKESFNQTIRQAIANISGQSENVMKEVITRILSKNGPVGGIRFDIEDEAFDMQPMVQMLPKLLVVPFEVLINICTANLSENNKDLMIGVMVDAYCLRFEQFVSQSTFSYAGALKLEECIRALNSHFSQVSTVSLRSRFSRLREIMLILTSDMSSIGQSNTGSGVTSHLLHELSQITEVEAQGFLALRTDFKEFIYSTDL